MRIAIIGLILLSSTAAEAQYRNYEVQPDGTGGYYGTYGNRNFEVRPDAGAAGNIYGRRPGVIQQRGIRAPRRNGAYRGNCVVDANGNAICQ
jgi:hypothetical protein